jgi:hypothetical protein
MSERVPPQDPRNWKEWRQHCFEGLEELRTVFRQLGKAIPPRLSNDLLAQLQDSHEETRSMAVVTLCLIALTDPSSHTLDRLIRYLRDSELDVRHHAACTLGALGYAPAVAGLVTMLQSSDRDERNEALAALAAIGRPSVAPLLSLLSNDNLPEPTRAIVPVVLFAMGPDVVDWLLQSLWKAHAGWEQISVFLAKAYPTLGAKKLLALRQKCRLRPRLRERIDLTLAAIKAASVQ